MELRQMATAGTLESSDVFVQVEPGSGGIAIEVESVVYQQFGPEIEKTVRDVLMEQDVADALVRLTDKGAVECVIRARVETALKRAKGGART